MSSETVGAGVAVERLSFSYGSAAILRDVDLAIAKGEFFAFLGPSGSGKTTLLRLIAGFGRPDSGRIAIDGRDITALPPAARNVGMVFQNYALWPHMSVAENVAFGLRLRRVGRGDREARVRAALAMVGLERWADRRPAQLSGGQQQRVALARTLVVEPQVLLLDEPLSNLDAKLRVEMRAELVALQRKTGVTTIYVTHDQEEANATADRMAVLESGRVQQVGTPMQLYDRPVNRFVAGFLGTANLIDGSVRIGPDGARFHASDLSIPLPLPVAEGRATLMIRPQSIHTVPPAAAAGANAATVEATLVRREFLGGSVRASYRVGELELLVESPHTPSLAAAVPDDRARLWIAPEACSLLPT